MRVLVTGGTGFVGREVVKQLHAAGHGMRVLVRDPSKERVREMAARWGVEPIRGDVLQPDSLAGALAGVEAVVHLVGIISEVGKSTFENVHVQGTRDVVEAAREAGVRRFVHMSALGTRPSAVSRYHQTKWAAEEIVRQSGLDYTIFRPSLIFGPDDAFVNLFAGIIRRSPVVPLIGSPKARFQPVAVETVGQAFVRALSEPRSSGQTYDLCGPETVTLPEMLDQIMGAMGKKRLKLRIPTGAAWLQAALLECVWPALLRKAPPLNRDQLLMLQEDNVGQPQRANEVLGLMQAGFRDGIRAQLASHNPHGVKPQSRTP